MNSTLLAFECCTKDADRKDKSFQEETWPNHFENHSEGYWQEDTLECFGKNGMETERVKRNVGWVSDVKTKISALVSIAMWSGHQISPGKKNKTFCVLLVAWFVRKWKGRPPLVIQLYQEKLNLRKKAICCQWENTFWRRITSHENKHGSLLYPLLFGGKFAAAFQDTEISNTTSVFPGKETQRTPFFWSRDIHVLRMRKKTIKWNRGCAGEFLLVDSHSQHGLAE